MIQMFKIWKGIDKLSFEDLGIQINTGNTRGHRVKIRKNTVRLNIRRDFFTFRVVNLWNSLPANILEVPKVEGFKLGLDKYMDGQGII